ncbi:MAG: phenylalanine--tRNA ligase subunit beta [Bacteroidia bacterium]|jgi:phenylalanyl-tRNA synthetase beta chain
MKISYQWLRELINLQTNPEETAALLTGCGLEVEGIEAYASVQGGLEGIVIGEVLTCIKHPNADKLSLTTVSVGTDTPLSIVCGAPNVEAGQKVLVATVGAKLYPTTGEPFEIKKSKIRGEVSEGMICAEDELGLGNSHAGIMVLPAEYETGAPASRYIPVYSDTVLEIGLTANRGDAASHLGVARDLKALTGIEITLPASDALKSADQLPVLAVELSDTEGCKRYSGIVVSGVTVKASPDWLKNKLAAIGIGSINNIVDATNYVLHELGQPLHAFDADKIKGSKIQIKKAKAGSKFITLDKTERTLNGNECMICDAEKPLALAGVFGELESGITENTKTIFIESAYFDAASIRRTAKFHGLSTDASYRYERGTDPQITLAALERVCGIILEIAGGSLASNVVDLYPEPVHDAQVKFSVQRLYNLIGQEIDLQEILQILTRLDIHIEKKSDDLYLLTIPAYRSDVKREADIAEEILRIYGLNKIAIPTQLKSTLTKSADEDAFRLRNKLANFLAHAGFVEMMSNSLTQSAYYSEEQSKDAVRLLNPLSSELDIMRMNMLFNGLEMIQYNRNRRVSDIRAFEFGYTYTQSEKGFVETPHFALYLTGQIAPESWIAPQRPSSYYQLKSTVEQFLQKAGIVKYTFQYDGNSTELTHYTQIVCKGKVMGAFGLVNNNLLKKFDIDQPVMVADLLWSPLKELAQQQKFEPEMVSAYPMVRRDLALLLDKSVRYMDLERIARKTETKLLKQIDVFDVYEGDKIEKGKKSYAISFHLQDDTKTLTDKEIETVMNKLVHQFEKELGAVLRS